MNDDRAVKGQCDMCFQETWIVGVYSRTHDDNIEICEECIDEQKEKFNQ